MMPEPTVAVGLVENTPSVVFELLDDFVDAAANRRFPRGEYHLHVDDGRLCCEGAFEGDFTGVILHGTRAESCFRIQVTIGIDFHWQRRQTQVFCGGIRIICRPGNLLTIINDVPLESYILSVSCSEMSASSPPELLKAHSIISRSWLLAQLREKKAPSLPQSPQNDDGRIIRWYDRQAHDDFDVCADDHCQRYQGISMITSGAVSTAVEATRGMALMHDGNPCDARFSKCCGGVTEDFRLAWDETFHPYLVPVYDGPRDILPSPPLSDEGAARRFILGSPDVYCNCADETILAQVLNSYDRQTRDFFRWRLRLTPEEIAGFVKGKLGLDLGRIVALRPVERGLSARLKRLALVGEKTTVVIGKELEIRRALSSSHLYSSAFVVDAEGPPDRPEAFILSGAGWGHGVGLCQIGAAVMAYRGLGCGDILAHYYPGTRLERLYH